MEVDCLKELGKLPSPYPLFVSPTLSLLLLMITNTLSPRLLEWHNQVWHNQTILYFNADFPVGSIPKIVKIYEFCFC